jgi:hypothetical protein
MQNEPDYQKENEVRPDEIKEVTDIAITHYKSVAVDYDTWEILVRWSEEECRTVGGQIRFLVKQYSPKEKPVLEQFRLQPKSQAKPIQQKIRGKSESQPEDGWTQRKCYTKRVHIKTTQRYTVMDLLFEYKEPLTNKEILALASKNWEALGIKSLEAVQKITAAMYSDGLIKRRHSLIIRENLDKFQYLLTPSSHRLLKARDKKRKKVGWPSGD